MTTQEQDTLQAQLGLKAVAVFLDGNDRLLSAEDYDNAERIYWASVLYANDPQIVSKAESFCKGLLDSLNGVREHEAEEERRMWPDEIGD